METLSSRKATRDLPSSALGMLLDSYHLSHAGSRRDRADRLWRHLHQSSTDDEQEREEHDSSASQASSSSTPSHSPGASDLSATSDAGAADDSSSSDQGTFLYSPQVATSAATLPQPSSPAPGSTRQQEALRSSGDYCKNREGVANPWVYLFNLILSRGVPLQWWENGSRQAQG